MSIEKTFLSTVIMLSGWVLIMVGGVGESRGEGHWWWLWHDG